MKISGIFAVGGMLNQAKNHARPVCRLGAANGCWAGLLVHEGCCLGDETWNDFREGEWG
jgi:hypothetical protein